ncbi:sigma 54-interacting transcriptional regulator [Fusobacterium simiae]|uniref:HTH-type transcriptional regulatory protein TyrR n=1 Tax=Fusobacterium simiae TaxID=855 RepID=A0ABT4DFK5_FUSSI|nr:sigma 54-interacting transcriptional regulator [Fusobacterium simiae]MCY7007367.1 sigma 54-interacting transcriptional regulator [Fusobacterium simiae]
MKKEIDIKNFDCLEILNNLYDGIYIVDGDGKTIFVNDAYCKITGIPREELIGKKVQEIQKKGLYKGSVTERVLKEKKVISSIGKSTITNKDILVTGTPIFDEKGKIKLIVINDRDISELKRLEIENIKYKEIQEKTDEKINFLNRKHILGKDISLDDLPTNISNIIKEISSSNITVLITGEFGTGKDSLAQKIYYYSNRTKNPFFQISCNEYEENLLEKELFGTIKEKNSHFGLLELANKGTLYISEIDMMSTKIQKKLLKVLNEKKLKKNGGEIINIDIRFIFSSNKDIEIEVKNKNFSKEFFEKINIISIKIPPLRERKASFSSFVNKFLIKFNKKYNKNINLLKDEMKLLKMYNWPGNLKELENFLERLVVTYNDGDDIKAIIKSMLLLEYSDILANQNLSLKEMMQKIEKNIIIKLLNQYGTVNKVAPILGISQPALSKKCKVLKILK